MGGMGSGRPKGPPTTNVYARVSQEMGDEIEQVRLELENELGIGLKTTDVVRMLLKEALEARAKKREKKSELIQAMSEALAAREDQKK